MTHKYRWFLMLFSCTLVSFWSTFAYQTGGYASPGDGCVENLHDWQGKDDVL
ncbi:hypothetical protein J007_05670 [Cryptococcus neoformans]|nr:hypothetical protein J007_05670 [Cryptococcus neoformans var. grubii]OXC58745.1 hypothetical protein C358_05788 [Cryptococcus neoformans var. grubii MW-RSA852]